MRSRRPGPATRGRWRRAAPALALVIVATSCLRHDGRWTRGPESGNAVVAGWGACDYTRAEHRPPDPAPPLGEAEALHYVARLIDGERCVSAAERARIARDTGALGVYARVLDGRLSRPYVDSTQALDWLASSDDPRPYLAHFLAYAVVDTSRYGTDLWQPAARGLLRLAPRVPAAGNRLTEMARRGGVSQRWRLTGLLVGVNDSAARAILRENANALASGLPPGNRLLRDVDAVLAAPAPPPDARGPCRERRWGRTPSGAFGCVRAVSGAVVIEGGKYLPIAEFERPAPDGRLRDHIGVSVTGPAFLGRRAAVFMTVDPAGSSGNALADPEPSALLAALTGSSGKPLSASDLKDSLVVTAAGGEATLVMRRRSAGGRRPFELAVTTIIPPHAPTARTIALTRSELHGLLRALREAATAARALDLAGVEKTIP